MPPESSPEEKVETPVSTEQTPDVQATSAPSTEEDRSSIGDIVAETLDALNPKSEESSASAPEAAKAAESQQPPEGEKPEGEHLPDWSEDDLKRLKPETQKRMRDLIAQRNERDERIKSLEPQVERYNQIIGGLQGTGLDSTDLNVGIDIMSAIKRGDYFAAREKLVPIVNEIMQRTGAILPADLAEEVRIGAITQDRAQELAESRARAAVSTQRLESTTKQTQERDQTTFMNSVVQTVNDWEAAKRKADPDWNLKADLVKEQITLKLRSGERPATVQDAVKMAENALKKVDDRLKLFRGAPRAVSPGPNGSSHRSRTRPEPKSIMDVVDQALTA
jgi:hypothetical protein